MGSRLRDWPCKDPKNFSQLLLNHSSNSKMTPVTCHPTHDQTVAPPAQVTTPEVKNILPTQSYQHAEEKVRPKRAASDDLETEPTPKHPRESASDTSF